MISFEKGHDFHRFEIAITSLSSNTQRGIRNGWRKIGQELKEELIAETRKPKTGKLYRIKGKSHRASAPGETAARITGRYGRSASYIPRQDELEFGVSSPYGGYLEYGTKHMEPRPGLQNAIKAKQNTMPQTMEAEIMRVLL